MKSRLNLLILVFAIIGLGYDDPSHAIDFRSGASVVVPANEVVNDDLYVAGDTVEIAGVVKGDLVAFASTVTVSGTVEGDLVSAGRVVVISGRVGDDVRIAGQILRFQGTVVDDFVAAGMSLEADETSQTGGSFVFSGLQAIHDGRVDEGMRVTAQGVELRGVVLGDVIATTGTSEMPDLSLCPVCLPEPMPTVAGGLEVVESAEIGGRLEYSAPMPATVSQQARIAGATEFDQIAGDAEAPATVASLAWKWVGRWMSLFLVGLLALWLVPRWFRGSSGRIEERPLRSLAWGLLSPLAIGVSIFVVLGIAVLVAVLLGWLKVGGLSTVAVALGVLAVLAIVLELIVGLGFLAPAVVAFCGGRYLLDRFGRSSGRGVVALLLGVTLLVGLLAIPVLGRLVALAAALFGFGALAQWLFEQLKVRFTHARPVAAAG